ncbi:MAG: FHA domain-containing protein [Anaerolineae bacterium]|nr:FHA domain-containing protein [Anaerolineae bacterium]
MVEQEISITFMSGPLDGQTLTFDQPDIGRELVINIGRREGCEIYLPFDNQVSRLHARLIINNIAVTATESVTDPFLLSFYLEDGGSRNGTFVERDKQPINGRVALRPGSFFRIGRTWLRLDVPLSM